MERNATVWDVMTEKNLQILDSVMLSAQGSDPEPLLPMFREMFCQNPADQGQIYVAVMPKVGRSACWYALGVSIAEAKQGFERRFAQHSLDTFSPGDRVALLPSKEVYEFAGIYEEYRLIRLSVVNDPRNGSFTLPLDELSRLQHADPESPIARRAPSKGELALTPLDLVIETRSFGNADFFDTEVIYLGRKSLFQNVMSNVEVARVVNGSLHKFASADVLPWGRIATSGRVSLESDEASHARPLVARANSALDIIEFCRANGVTNRHIVVDSAQFLERELASLCRLMDEFHCKITAFCGFKDFRLLSELEDTGRIFPSQIRPEKIYPREQNGIFQRVASSANRAVNFEWIENFLVSHEIVDGTAEKLETISEALRALEFDTEREFIVGRAFSVLRTIVNPQLSGARSEEVASFVAALSMSFEKVAQFWPAAERAAFTDVLTNLQRLAESSDEIASIKRMAAESLIARPLSPEELNQEDVIFLVDDGGATLVLSGWPRRAKVQQFVFEYDYKDVFSVAFAFEERWFRLFNKSYRDAELYAADPDTPYRPTINQEASKRFWSPRGNDQFVAPDRDRSFVKSKLAAINDSDPEASLPTTLIWFSDDHLCPLADGGKLPTIKNISRSMGTDNLQIDLVGASAIEPGDLCVFRTGSDSDLVKSLARHSMGVDLYEETRSVAGSWQYALDAFIVNNHLNVSDLQAHLKSVGLDRTVTTIRNWLYSPTAIGPQNEGDLVDILEAIGATTLTSKATEIWSAISSIRSSHRSAGTNVSKMLRDELVSSFSGAESLTGHYRMSLGEVDVLEVDTVERDQVSIKATLVNRLLRPERLGL